jgi:hypothetical protein
MVKKQPALTVRAVGTQGYPGWQPGLPFEYMNVFLAGILNKKFWEEPICLQTTRIEKENMLSKILPLFINSFNSKKTSGYDLITVLILKSLPPIGIKYLTQLFNSALFLRYFPDQWKVAQIILLLKPGKPPYGLQS